LSFKIFVNLLENNQIMTCVNISTYYNCINSNQYILDEPNSYDIKTIDEILTIALKATGYAGILDLSKFNYIVEKEKRLVKNNLHTRININYFIKFFNHSINSYLMSKIIPDVMFVTNSLPNDIWNEIIQYTSLRTILALECVNNHLYKILWSKNFKYILFMVQKNNNYYDMTGMTKLILNSIITNKINKLFKL
jgi:hypothetical protein